MVTGKTKVTVPYDQDALIVKCGCVHTCVYTQYWSVQQRDRQSRGAKGLAVILATDQRWEIEKRERDARRREEEEEL